MAGMEPHKLQITLHSGKGLSDIKNFGTMDPYAVVWIAGDDGKVQSNPHKTETAIKGASCPIWDCCMEFNVPSMQHVDNYTLFCDIKHAGKLFDREIGQVKVAFRDLLAGGAASGEKLCYHVKNSSGEIHGEIIFSYKCLGDQKDVIGGGAGKKVKAKAKKTDGKMKFDGKGTLTGHNGINKTMRKQTFV